MDPEELVRAVAADYKALFRRVRAAHGKALAGLPVKVQGAVLLRDGYCKAGLIFRRGGTDQRPDFVPEGRLYPVAGLPQTPEAAKTALVLAALEMGKLCRAEVEEALAACPPGKHVVLWRYWGPEVSASQDGAALKLVEAYAVQCLSDEQERTEREKEPCR